MVESIIKAALVGCGKVADTHARGLQASGRAQLVAVSSRSRERAQACGERYHAAAYTNLGQMLDERKPQLLVVCTPHPAHADDIVAAAERGCHVLTEKPLAPDLQSCDRAIAACRANGVKLGVVSQRRLYPCVQRMRAAIQAGKIGRPVLATLTVMGWRSPEYYLMDGWRGQWDSEGGGVMVNQTVHQLDVFQWLMGEVDELFGYWDNFNHPSIEVEDTAVAVARFKSGALGQILLSNSQKPGFWGKLHVHGSNGASVGAQTEGGSPFVAGVTTAIDPPINDIWTVPGEEGLLAQWQDEDRALAERIDTMSYYHFQQIVDMLDAIQQGREPMVNGEEGRKSVELFTAVYRSQRDHAPIPFPLTAETGRGDYDGRLTHPLFSRRS